ncbi:MAG: four helix bundle protein [Clostridium sp.]|nr:four helix bundle protein [Clostridium sp.]
MKFEGDNIILFKSKRFAIRIIKLFQCLIKVRCEREILRQLLKSGTSIGANVKEAVRGQSRADFGTKMNIALKEASESEYWLELLFETDIINEQAFESLITDCRELLRLLTSIVKSTFNK